MVILTSVPPVFPAPGRPQKCQKRCQVAGIAELGIYSLHPHPRRLEKAVQGDVVLKHRRDEERCSWFQSDLVKPFGQLLSCGSRHASTVMSHCIWSVTECAHGVCFKPLRAPYRAGARAWAKYKVRATEDAIVGAVTGPVTAPRTMLLGRYDTASRLRYIGRTTPPAPHHRHRARRAAHHPRHTPLGRPDLFGKMGNPRGALRPPRPARPRRSGRGRRRPRRSRPMAAPRTPAPHTPRPHPPLDP